MDNHHAKNLERCVFFISDGTAITAETLGHAVLSQFPLNFSSYTLPFVTSEKRAEEIKQKIDQIYSKTHLRPLVFYSIISPTVKKLLPIVPAVVMILSNL